jgi:hypothetical protein
MRRVVSGCMQSEDARQGVGIDASLLEGPTLHVAMPKGAIIFPLGHDCVSGPHCGGGVVILTK